MISYRKANSTDLAHVLRLLQSHNLPTADVPGHFDHFAVAVENEQVVGCIGMEIYGSDALLRSLAVDKQYQGRQIGDQLYHRLVEEAGSQQISKLHLLTTTAENYFAKRGFALAQRDRSPQAIQSTSEFSELCPSTARYMVKSLK